MSSKNTERALLKRIQVDFSKCLGCLQCQLACAGAHSKAGSAAGAVAMHEKPSVSMNVVAYGGMAFPLQCRQCEEARCMDVCTVKALTRDEKTGAIVVDKDVCFGCMMCAMVCPYGAITEGRNRSIAKCDLCYDKKYPACVASCPTGALSYKETNASAKDRQIKFAVDYIMGKCE